jgi:hypothetical protein
MAGQVGLFAFLAASFAVSLASVHSQAKINASRNWGKIMRTISIAKVFVFGFAVALAVTMPLGLSAASAKAMKHTMKLAPGACAFEKKAVNAGTICSYQCNAQTNWCGQQLCVNGALNQVLPCFGPFCTPKCAG